MASHEIEAPLGRGVTFNLGAESSKEKRRAQWARRMRGSLKNNAEGISDTDPMDYNAKDSPVINYSMNPLSKMSKMAE